MNTATAIARRTAYGLCIVSALLLTACGTRHVSKDITPEGRAGAVVFPDPDRIVLKGGTFPNLEDLRAIGPGVTKDQLYQALGRPHFREGLFGVREWDYLFHVRTDTGTTTCQYKVIFDDEQRGQSFHWAPASCADLVAARTQPAAAAMAPGASRFDVQTDTLFAFARYGRGDILPHGEAELAALGARLAAARRANVRVVGHTDRIGGEQANQRLSERRAATVRTVLVEHGVPAASIASEGRGKSQPVTRDCADGMARAALIECLKPDRRVEILVTGEETG